MSLPLLPTTLIGSMPKPGWLTSEWFSITEKWRLSGKELAEAFDDATRLALADQERAGIDIVCDGEQRRPTHFSYGESHARPESQRLPSRLPGYL